MSPERVGRPPGRGPRGLLSGHQTKEQRPLGGGKWSFRQRQVQGAWGKVAARLQRRVGVRSQKAFSTWPWSAAFCLFFPSASLMFNLSSRSHSRKVSGPCGLGCRGCIVTHQKHHSWFRGKKSNLETEERAGFRGIDPTFLSIRAYLLILPPRRPSCS